MSELKFSKKYPKGAAEVGTQYGLAKLAVIKDVPTVAYKTEPHKVITLTTSEHYEAAKSNWISKIKTIGTLTEYVNISSLKDMDGVEILSGDTALDESDELTGPFSSITLSSSQPTLSAGIINIMVWEYING